jgi:putative tributyrin esterase
MAVIDVNFFSNSLARQVSYKAIIPVDGPVFPGRPAKEVKPFKTVYLLHGIFGDYTDWLIKSRVALFAEKYNLAVIMPSGENGFYVDNEATRKYFGEYIGRELVEETRKLFHLSNKRGDTFIAGLSMGGYGALRNGLKYYNNFSAIAALSSALIIDAAITSTEENPFEFGRRSYYEAVFGDVANLRGSDKDVEALVQKIKKENGVMPEIYLACGTEDSLIENNRKFRDFLISENVEHTYLESPGIHDWQFWDEYIEKVMEWLVNKL